ncbi:H-NS family nucleoid-associated regulatory protein [Rhodanobacter sp. 115]|uniref:H-NS histone family protein n=1 Tax=Rhodanobacter sp. FW021-MT20 TaxID=1162282 RepID=UPI0034E5754C
MAINLDSLSPAELQALIKSAEAQMSAARQNHIKDVRTKIDSILASAGLTIVEIYPTRGRKGGAKLPKAPVAPKYRNPADASQTWSGRGKRPAWFVEALSKKGVTAETLLIAGPATKSAKKAAKKASPKKAAAKK